MAKVGWRSAAVRCRTPDTSSREGSEYCHATPCWAAACAEPHPKPASAFQRKGFLNVNAAAEGRRLPRLVSWSITFAIIFHIGVDIEDERSPDPRNFRDKA